MLEFIQSLQTLHTLRLLHRSGNFDCNPQTFLSIHTLLHKVTGVLFQYVIYRAIFIPICDLPLATPHTTNDVPPATP